MDERSDRVRIESTRDTRHGTDLLTLDYHRNDARIVHRFVAEDDTTVSAVVSLRLLSLIEHRPVAGGTHYGPGAETVAQQRIDGLDPEPLEVDDLPDGGYRILARYPIPDPRTGGLTDGTLTITLTMHAGRTRLAGDTLDPTEAHLLVRIDRYPFQETDTRLALEWEVSADRPLANAAATRDALLVTADRYQTYLEWADTARVGLDDERVAVTLLSHLDDTGGESARLYAAMPQSILLTHDQVLGTMRFATVPDAIREAVLRGDAAVYGAALLVALLAVGVPVARRLREA